MNQDFTYLYHVGLPKTATTTLQKIIFPFLHQKSIIDYDPLSYHKGGLFYRASRIKLDSKDIQKNAIEFIGSNSSKFKVYSSESLLSHDPLLWPKRINECKSYIPKESHILLCLRNPREWLESIYSEMIKQSYHVLDEKSYFLGNKESLLLFNMLGSFSTYNHLNIEQFIFHALIKSWLHYFDKVTIIPFEELLNLNFLTYIGINIPPKTLKQLQELMQKKNERKAHCNSQIKLIEARNRLIFKFSKSFNLLDKEIEKVKCIIGIESLETVKIKEEQSFLVIQKALQKLSIDFLDDEYHIVKYLIQNWNSILSRPELVDNKKFRLCQNNAAVNNASLKNEVLYRKLLKSKFLQF